MTIGSFGISGAADTILVMANKASGSILGTATEVHVSEQRARVQAALEGADEGLGVAEIQAAAHLSTRNAADLLLLKMTRDGEIERIKRGVYGLPGTRTKLAAKNAERFERKKD